MKKRRTPDEAKEQVLILAYRRERPILVGEATVAIGPCWNLAEATELLWEMVSEGDLRTATTWEYTRWDILKEADAFLDSGVKEGNVKDDNALPRVNGQLPPPFSAAPDVDIPTLKVPDLRPVPPRSMLYSRFPRAITPLLPVTKRARRPMTRFLLDVDDVLADFALQACVEISKILGRVWTYDDAPKDDWDMFGNLDTDTRGKLDAVMHAPGWCASLPIVHGSQAFVADLKELCKGGVFACTTHMHTRNWTFERDNWLGEHFGIDRDHIIHTSAKFVCGADFYLDDKPPSIYTWQRDPRNRDGRAMLWSTDHNRRLEGHDDIRVHDFEEVLSVVRRDRARSIRAPA